MADKSTARQRKAAAAAPASPTKPIAVTTKDTTKPKKNGFSALDLLRPLVGLLLLSVTLSYLVTGNSYTWGYRPWWSQWPLLKRALSGPVVLTDEQLTKYDGTDPKLPIYVAINGTIYDVSASPQTYGPKGSYGFFSGKDSARAFVTGCLKEDLNPDLRGVELMFMPIDLTPYNAEADREKYTPAQLKIRTERERRFAKIQAAETMNHWVKVFEGQTGRPYFKAGYIKRPADWEKTLGPVKELCAQAAKQRPARGKWEAELQKRLKMSLGQKQKSPWE